MSSRSLRPPRATARWLAAWVLCWTVALGLCPHVGHAYTDNVSTFGDSQGAPKGDRNGGDPDGVGLGSPVPPQGNPPFAPEPEPHDSGRSLSPDALRLWILQLLIDIAI